MDAPTHTMSGPQSKSSQQPVGAGSLQTSPTHRAYPLQSLSLRQQPGKMAHSKPPTEHSQAQGPLK